MDDPLGFQDAVAAHIVPRLSPLGFRVIAKTPSLVSLESPVVRFDIVRDDNSFEIEAFFVAKREPECQLALVHVLLAEDPERRAPSFFQASTRESVEWCVRRIGEELDGYCRGVLVGDPGALARARAAAESHGRAVVRELVQGPVRSKAEVAWQRHDYAAVQELYGSIEADLSPAEKAKLAYARRHG